VLLTNGAAATASPAKGNLPDLRGRSLSSAKHRARVAGFRHVKSHDATPRHRKQRVGSHWKVCAQRPHPGRTSTATIIQVGVVGIHQVCPPLRRRTPAVSPAPPPVPPRSSPAEPKPTKPTTTRPVPPPAPPAPPVQPDLCGAPANPMGYTFCGGSTITAPDPRTCEYFTCIPNFDNGRGYLVACADGKVGMSGGIQGACSSHGGVGQQVYRR
jgi:hypothetical protein